MNQPKWGEQTCLLDTYNQTIYTDFAPTISTRVDASNNTYIMEVIQIGNYIDDTDKKFKNPQMGRVYSSEGLSPCIDTCGGGNREVKIMEVKVIGKCWKSSQNGLVYSTEGVSPTIMCGSHSGVEPKIKVPQATKRGFIEVEPGGVFDAAYPDSSTSRGRVQEGGKVAPTLCTSNELCLYEGIEHVGFVNDGKHQQDYIQGTNGISKAVCAGSHASTPHLLKTQLPNYRIRKLTPRECFRLMAVSEKDIDTIQAAGISNSQQYKLAGNSIVVDVLYHIFNKMFVDKENENAELTLF